MLQDPSRKLLQIDDSTTTVTAAPLSAANATANVSSSLLAPPSDDSKPHSILADVISSFKSKYGKSPEVAPASATANATANAVIISDDHDALAIDISDDDSMDYYMEPCSDGPVPSAYESFVQASTQSQFLHLHLCLCYPYAHPKACKSVPEALQQSRRLCL